MSYELGNISLVLKVTPYLSKLTMYYMECCITLAEFILKTHSQDSSSNGNKRTAILSHWINTIVPNSYFSLSHFWANMMDSESSSNFSVISHIQIINNVIIFSCHAPFYHLPTTSTTGPLHIQFPLLGCSSFPSVPP